MCDSVPAAPGVRWWSRAARNGRTEALCGLCAHNWRIPAGKSGYCGSRFFDGTELLSPCLGRISSIAVDPIEKKPLYHWRPGSFILSLGSLGCTMRCPFCQNHGIAQPGPLRPERLPRLTAVSPEALAAKTRELGLRSVAYTYNEPALQAEYILAAAPILREAGIATVLVSNGMYSEALLGDLVSFVDAANIDVKCFNPGTYARLGGSLAAVMRTVPALLSAGVHVEVTTLVVPGVSDSPEEFARELDWLADLSPELPLHISRYRPAHKFTAPPTDIALLQRFAAMAGERLKHVHVGNVPRLVRRR
jgi:pyruvate formate lyase activating enzyme